MEITNRNFYRLLRSGAFDEHQELEPMSQFKWKRILQLAVAQDVNIYIAKGFSNCMSDPHLQLSSELKNELQPYLGQSLPDVSTTTLAIMKAEPNPANILIRRRMKKIIQKDDESEDSSIATQQLLRIIVHNTSETLSRGISLRGIIEMGRYLRERGDRVDYVKLEEWLHKLGFIRFASLLGSILIRFFGFDIQEIPFIQHEEKNAVKLARRYLENTAADTAENWHFRMRTNGMVENNSRVLRRNLGRSVKYLRYNPFETTSNFLANFARSLAEIEE